MFTLTQNKKCAKHACYAEELNFVTPVYETGLDSDLPPAIIIESAAIQPNGEP